MSEPIEGRLHPVTPLRRSWVVLLGLGTYVYQQHDLVSVGTTGTKDKIDVPLWAACITVALAVTVVVGVFATAWRYSHYRLDGDALGYRSGLLFKVRRHCELRHVQSVDIVRPFLGRLIGVCTLRVVMSGTTMTLSYLTLNQARALKARILAEDTAEETLYRVKTSDLIVSLLLDLGTNISSLVLAATGLVPFFLSGEPLALSTLIAFAPKVWRLTGKRLFVWSGWSVTRTAEGSYRTDYGLFDAQQYTYRDTRIASIELHQPLLWRRFDWVQVKVGVAGASTPGVLAPVCPRSIAEKLVLHLLGPNAVAHLDDPVPAPRAAWKATPFYKALGYRLNEGYFTAWNGLFLRNLTTVCPAARIQTVTVDQGPWQRRLGLATVRADMAGGARVSAAHRTDSEAEDLGARLYAASMRHPARVTVPNPARPYRGAVSWTEGTTVAS
ncbi:PH domain-containing protein [Streptomyces sp. NPDC058268]|uniref:PH domain-containing protein n=1 Tax=Streptomyces sp. NPDC058268 TaxID=3346413 RepID=UPI0036E48DFA